MGIFGDALGLAKGAVGEVGSAMGLGGKGGDPRTIREDEIRDVEGPSGSRARQRYNRARQLGQYSQDLGVRGAQAYDQGLLDMMNSRAAQMNALGLQEQAALGQAPSAAEAQLQQGLDRGISAQQSMAASNVGNPALAQRNAMIAGNQMALQNNAQAAQLRAQEMAQARQAFANQAGAIRQADAAGASLGAQTGLSGYRQRLGAEELANQELLRQQQLDQQAQIANQNKDLGIATANIGVREANQQRRSKFVSDLMGAAGSAVALSDERAKENIKDADKDMDEFLKALTPKSYKYKPGYEKETEGKGVHGIMAQDLEKSKAGKSLVKEIGGLKHVDTRMGFGTALAALARLNQRVSDLEKE